MFDRLTTVEKIIGIVGSVIAPLGIIIAGAISYGELRADVTALTKDVAALKRPADPKAALCGTLTTEMGLAIRTNDDQGIRNAARQLDRMGCYPPGSASTASPETD